jgi:hypothetical protein
VRRKIKKCTSSEDFDPHLFGDADPVQTLPKKVAKIYTTVFYTFYGPGSSSYEIGRKTLILIPNFSKC